jgi:hypothetical protein
VCSYLRGILAIITLLSDLMHGMQTYDASEIDALVEKYDKLNWRIISKPGGATVKPDEYYTIYGYPPPPPAPGHKGGNDYTIACRQTMAILNMHIDSPQYTTPEQIPKDLNRIYKAQYNQISISWTAQSGRKP